MADLGPDDLSSVCFEARYDRERTSAKGRKRSLRQAIRQPDQNVSNESFVRASPRLG
jgi:hypothetical protein